LQKKAGSSLRQESKSLCRGAEGRSPKATARDVVSYGTWKLTETQVCVCGEEGCPDWISEVGAPRQADAQVGQKEFRVLQVRVIGDVTQHDRGANIDTCLDLSQVGKGSSEGFTVQTGECDSHGTLCSVDEGRRVTPLDGKRGVVVTMIIVLVRVRPCHNSCVEIEQVDDSKRPIATSKLTRFLSSNVHSPTYCTVTYGYVPSTIIEQPHESSSATLSNHVKAVEVEPTSFEYILSASRRRRGILALLLPNLRYQENIFLGHLGNDTRIRQRLILWQDASNDSAMANVNPDHDMESNFDDDEDDSRSKNLNLCQALPAEVKILDTSPKPPCMDLKTNLENTKLKCTIRHPPVLLYLPDDTSSTPTITAFFHIITELLSIAQSEYNLVMLHRERPAMSTVAIYYLSVRQSKSPRLDYSELQPRSAIRYCSESKADLRTKTKQQSVRDKGRQSHPRQKALWLCSKKTMHHSSIHKPSCAQTRLSSPILAIRPIREKKKNNINIKTK
ncbi:hypothetical protein KCU72_g5, partial [Aureobasidium melanogenum]